MAMTICAFNLKPAAAAKTTGARKSTFGKKFTDINAAVKAGAVQGCAPFPEGVDFFGFYNSIDEKEAQRYADGEFLPLTPLILLNIPLFFIYNERARPLGASRTRLRTY